MCVVKGSTQTMSRGTTNRNSRGGSAARSRRRRWLVNTFAADRDIWSTWVVNDYKTREGLPRGGAQAACRCYRCGRLLTCDTVTVDRIIPGCKGGTYRRNNIRPACAACNSETGGGLRR